MDYNKEYKQVGSNNNFENNTKGLNHFNKTQLFIDNFKCK